MIIAPLDWSDVPGATFETPLEAHERGFPAANLTDADVHRPAVWRGNFRVTAAERDIPGNDGSPFTAQVSAGLHHSPAEMAAEVRTALNAVSSNWYAYHNGTTGRMVMGRTSGTASLAPTAASWLVVHGGFSLDARASAAEHTGDFAAVMGGGDELRIDLGSAKAATHSFLFGLQASAGAQVRIDMGTVSGGSTAKEFAPSYVDGNAMMIPYSAPQRYQYVTLRIFDPTRETHARTALRVWYHGPVLDTSDPEMHDAIEYETGSFQRSWESTSTLSRTVDGHPTFAALRPRETFTANFSAAPGVAGSVGYGIEDLLEALGRTGYAFVNLDPDEPHRETRLCYFPDPPQPARLAKEHKGGRWRFPLTWRAVEPV